jgi:hypothetical protein
MSTWGDLLADIRTDLRDTGTTNRRWTDESIYLWAKDAMRDYSLHFPVRVDQELLTESGGAYALPSHLIAVLEVECPLGRFLEPRNQRPGVQYSFSGQKAYRYHLKGGSLYLEGSPLDGENVYLTYQAFHSLPASAAATSTALTIPPEDEELIRLYVKAKANEQIRGQQANLDRFRLGSGERTDNPLEPEVANLMETYHQKIAERYRGGVVYLYRAGRVS